MRTTTRETLDLEALQTRLQTLQWRMEPPNRITGKFQLYDRWGVYRGEFDVAEAEDYLEGISWDLEELDR